MQDSKKTNSALASVTKVAKNYAMYIALAVIFVVFQIMSGGKFLTAFNVTNLVNQTGYIAVLAVGMTLVLIICQIDLSVGFLTGFLGACAARLLLAGVSIPLTVLIVLVFGALLGLLQGFIIGKVGVPAFVTTLAGEFAFRGLLTLITQDIGTINVTSKTFKGISQGFLPALFKVPLFGKSYHGLTLVIGVLAVAVVIIANVRQRNDLRKYKLETGSVAAFVVKNVFFSALILALTILLASYQGISWTVVIVAAVTAAYHFVLTKTKVGRHIYGMGGNAEAAKLSGVNIKKVLMGIYMSMGAMAALSGIMITSRMGCAQPTTGTGYELDAIASCYIAGVSTSGGVGSVINSVVGAFVIMSLTNGLNLIGVGISYQYIIKGIIFVVAVAIDVRGRGRKALG